MAWVAGVDGCRAGWFRICREIGSGRMQFDVLGSALGLRRWHPVQTTLRLMSLQTVDRLSRAAERFGQLITLASQSDPVEVPAETWRRLARAAAEVSALADEMARQADGPPAR